MKLGIKLILASLVSFPLVLGFAILEVNSPGPLLFPLTLFLWGLARLIYARYMDDPGPISAAPVYVPAPQPIAMPLQTPYIPPAAPALPESSTTNDLSWPQIVVEKTTGLLPRQK
ncbi:MAG: hypothetical protein ACKV2V_23230 [Blastocatellia bacterium]